jgi:hypothetical protein
MARTKRTLAESIELKARETQVSRSFVERVRSMFEGKGIPLDADAGPFEKALGDAFARQAAVHHTLEAARRRLETPFALVPGDYDRCFVPGPGGVH